MSLIKHARRIAEKAKAATDDLDAIHPADDADTAFVKESLRGHRPARDVLPAAALLDALGPAGLRRLQSPEGLGLIVQVPGPDWVPHVEQALRGVTDFAHIFSRSGSSKTQDRPSEGNDRACSLLSQGARVAGVSHAPERYLPAALVAGADLIVRIGPPSNRIVAHVIREVTGKRARRIPPLVAATELQSETGVYGNRLARLLSDAGVAAAGDRNVVGVLIFRRKDVAASRAFERRKGERSP